MNRENIIEAWKKISVADKSTKELYAAITEPVMKELAADWKRKNERTVSYLSIEFLVGRMFFNNLMELGLLDEAQEIFARKGLDINRLEEIEDAALGNGGLGRLAACFLDSAAGRGYCVNGYGIRYRYGLFRQTFEDGYQREADDDWMTWGDPWSIRRESEQRIIKFKDMEITAVPYDMPIIGTGRIGTLRLFQAEGDKKAAKISEYLYPADHDREGKLLRIRQEYFFSAAAVGDLIDRYVKANNTRFDKFAEENAIQLNDTHPVFAIAEFIRVLTKEYKVTFQNAVAIAKKTFSYTNHTILSEALECWDEDLLEAILPEISLILKRLYIYALSEWRGKGCSNEDIKELSLMKSRNFRMANIAVFIAKRINGVAELHTQILKDKLFSAAYRYYPERFVNVTNGVTPRRWLMLCNKELSALYDRLVGRVWRSDLSQIAQIDCADEKVLQAFDEVKQEKKRQLARYIEEREGVKLLPQAIYVAQVKRLHEYKRQLMTAFAILHIYFDLKEGTISDFTPMVFIFGGKAASGYKRAKAVIKFINDIAEFVNGDPEVNQKLQVVFVQDYDVSYAEKIVAGSDVSAQVSTAGFEASGTGNMKFMMNGSVTVGTMDGANIEIAQRAEGVSEAMMLRMRNEDFKNNYIFGASAEKIAKMRESYDPCVFVKKQPRIMQVVNVLTDGTFGDKIYLRELYDCLFKDTYNAPDYYFVLYDLADYVKKLLKINIDYKDRRSFLHKQLTNATRSAFFSSDRAIDSYAKNIWDL